MCVHKDRILNILQQCSVVSAGPVGTLEKHRGKDSNLRGNGDKSDLLKAGNRPVLLGTALVV